MYVCRLSGNQITGKGALTDGYYELTPYFRKVSLKYVAIYNSGLFGAAFNISRKIFGIIYTRIHGHQRG